MSSFSGTIPQAYDQYLAPSIFEPYAEVLARYAPVQPGARVLEIAAGTGRLTRRLLGVLAPDAELVATDINPDMLAHAQHQIDDTRVRWEPADAQALPYADGVFDAVFCQFGVMFYKDKALGQREAFRVLRAGGSYAFAVWGSLHENRWAAITHQVVRELLPHDPPQFMALPFSYHDEHEIRATLADAGFSEIEMRRLTLDLVATSAERFAIGAVTGNPLLTALAERGVTDPLPVVREVAARFRAAFGDHPMRSRMTALVVSASRPS